MLGNILSRRFHPGGNHIVTWQHTLNGTTGKQRFRCAPQQKVVEDNHRVFFDVFELGVLWYVFEFAIEDDVTFWDEDSGKATTKYLHTNAHIRIVRLKVEKYVVYIDKSKC